MRVQIAVLALLVSTSGCIRRGLGDEVEHAELPPPAPPADRSAALEAELIEVRRELSAREVGLQDASVGHAALSQRVDELSQLNAEVTERLRSSTQGVEQLAAERARLATALAEAQARLQQLEGGNTPPPATAEPPPASSSSAPSLAPPPAPPSDEVASAPE
jgi:chromosome segregation ATPase